MQSDSTLARLRESQPDGLEPSEHEQLLARVLSASREVPFASQGPAADARRRSTRRALVLGVAVAGVVAAVALGVVLSGDSPPATRSTLRSALPSGASVHGRLVAALNQASDDVVEVRTTIHPRPQFRPRVIVRWTNASGSAVRVSDSGGDRLQPPEEIRTTITSSGTTTTTLFPLSKVFTVQQSKGRTPVPPLDGQSFRSSIEGADHVVASRAIVDGHPSIELTDRLGNLHLWIDKFTYLPLKEVLGSGALSSEVDWSYFSPSASLLKNLQLSIPSGFHQVEKAPSTWTPPTTAPS
jgi:hypothetical protein